ncbi:CIC11C00000001081 [Sungouiella intermedia]|uniref:chitin deacetylase n=1 Tax=Sungouiella intermedia TaxID=45354 RepID=A0A1L0DP93_9ASCO|nr:CIC11C00000001081 [[Candida] intermedia]
MKYHLSALNLLSTASALNVLLNFDFFTPSVAPIQCLPSLPFPQWLTDFTGLKEWPGMDPPYIKLDFINFDQVPLDLNRWIHQQGQCAPELKNQHVCSFDCFNCVAADDAYTCPVLSQTFDDGPSPYTPELVGQLKSKSTFFTIGVNVVRYPQVYIETASQGHIMGCHTWSHKFLPSLSNEEVVAQIEWSIWAMNATYGHLPKWFRPPYGGIDNRIRSILRQFGMQAVLWDYDTTDWRYVSDTTLAEGDVYSKLDTFIKSSGKRGLILEHDSVQKTVNMGIKIHKQIGSNQMTVPQCVGGIDYIKEFPRPKIV